MEWQQVQEGTTLYEWKWESGVFLIRFTAPEILQLHPEFEQMIWDQTLRLAHHLDHIPIGPVVHTVSRTAQGVIEQHGFAPATMVTVEASVIST